MAGGISKHEGLSATPATPAQRRRSIWSLATLFSLTMFSPVVSAADLQPIPESPPPPPQLTSGWTFRAIPYGWLLGLYGNSTVKGRTVGVNLPFDKIVKESIGSGGTLL